MLAYIGERGQALEIPGSAIFIGQLTGQDTRRSSVNLDVVATGTNICSYLWQSQDLRLQVGPNEAPHLGIMRAARLSRLSCSVDPKDSHIWRRPFEVGTETKAL
jgi:hypothetical protein